MKRCPRAASALSRAPRGIVSPLFPPPAVPNGLSRGPRCHGNAPRWRPCCGTEGQRGRDRDRDRDRDSPRRGQPSAPPQHRPRGPWEFPSGAEAHAQGGLRVPGTGVSCADAPERGPAVPWPRTRTAGVALALALFPLLPPVRLSCFRLQFQALHSSLPRRLFIRLEKTPVMKEKPAPLRGSLHLYFLSALVLCSVSPERPSGPSTTRRPSPHWSLKRALKASTFILPLSTCCLSSHLLFIAPCVIYHPTCFYPLLCLFWAERLQLAGQ